MYPAEEIRRSHPVCGQWASSTVSSKWQTCIPKYSVHLIDWKRRSTLIGHKSDLIRRISVGYPADIHRRDLWFSGPDGYSPLMIFFWYEHNFDARENGFINNEKSIICIKCLFSIFFLFLKLLYFISSFFMPSYNWNRLEYIFIFLYYLDCQL